jgi:cellulose synthase/poly-beta-1,6-N-acetylglucosamine synthase-like glycosyltransferase
MTVSIIIAVKTWQKNLEECVAKCLELDFSDFEIIILPDEPLQVSIPEGKAPIVVIPTGPVKPSDKRDIALKYAKGEILAFLDDDTYPEKDWLKNAVNNFKDSDVAAVGGPGVTPATDLYNLASSTSSSVLASKLVSGPFNYRYVQGVRKEVDDYPSCNLLVRKSVMQELGGFDTKFWPGEDTKLCLDITKKLKKKIIYDPNVLAYHHRRPDYLAHLRQVASYALHRGYFVKKYPETSLKFSYFVPTLFVLAMVCGGILFLIFPAFKLPFLLGLSTYFLLVFIFSLSKDLRLIIRVFIGIIFSHITYGIFFLKGLLSSRLPEGK